MYNGVNDENNQGAFNDENSLYHYSYSKDRDPQPGQPDPSQTSWQPASRPEDPVSPEEPVAYTTGTCQDDPQPPKPEKGSFWKKTGTKVTALVLCCALIGGLCGFGGAALARRGGKATIQESGRTASAVSVKSVDGQTLMSPAEVYAATVNSVVSINCSAVSTNIFGQRVQSASSGSGFVITQDGYIVTNQHVVSGASSVNVTLYNGDTYPATVVGGDSDYDVAVLKIEATGLHVYFIDPVNRCIGASHSGWRGTVADITHETVQLMNRTYGAKPEDIHAFIGPSICQDCYEVDESVAEKFRSAYSQNEICMILYHTTGDKYQLNLQAANYFNMIHAGIKPDNIGISDICTSCNSDWLFSHRASHGKRGVLCGFMSICR